MSLIHQWFQVGQAWSNFEEGHANLHRVLSLMGFDAWITAITGILLVIFALWVLMNRRSDPWILVGVAAITGRLVIHHRLHDDGLVFMAFIPLIRLALSNASESRVRLTAGFLFTLNWVALLMPGSFLNEPGPLRPLSESIQVLVWLSTLIFLMRCISMSMLRGKSVLPESHESPGSSSAQVSGA